MLQTRFNAILIQIILKKNPKAAVDCAENAIFSAAAALQSVHKCKSAETDALFGAAF